MKNMLLMGVMLLIAGCAPQEGVTSGSPVPALEKSEALPTREVFINWREDVRGVRPRLFVDRAALAELRAAILPGGTHEKMWAQFIPNAQRNMTPPKDPQKQTRGAGNRLANHVVAWKIGGEEAFLNSVQVQVQALIDDEHWGDHYMYPSSDLVAGHMLLAGAMAYDWCYDDLGQELLEALYQKLLLQMERMNAAQHSDIWWHDDYLGNHMWVNLTGAVAVGLAIYDDAVARGDSDRVFRWLEEARKQMDFCMELHGADGASIEGFPYWAYGLEYLLHYMDFSRKFFNTDWFDPDHLEKTADYGVHSMLPRNSWSHDLNHVDYADSARVNWYGPNYLFRILAAEGNNPQMQRQAEEVDQAGFSEPIAAWMGVLGYHPGVPLGALTDREPFKYFDDVEMVFSRSDWSGDESLLFFKCGPPLGHRAHTARGDDTGDWGAAHVHPDANTFLLFGAGEWLIRSAGYVHKFTGYENSLLVDGRGQLGEGKMFFDSTPVALKNRPWIRKAFSGDVFDHLVGNAAPAYSDESELIRYDRHLLYLNELDVLLVVDDIEAAAEKEFELRFFPEVQEVLSVGSHAFMTEGASARLRMQLLTPGQVVAKVEPVPIQAKDGKSFARKALSLSVDQKEKWMNVVAFSWSGKGGRPAVVALHPRGRLLGFDIGELRLELNLETGLAIMDGESSDVPKRTFQ